MRLAYQAMDLLVPSINHDSAVPTGVGSEPPEETVVSGVGDGLFKRLLCLVRHRFVNYVWVAVAAPSLIVGVAPSMSVNTLSAAFD